MPWSPSLADELRLLASVVVALQVVFLPAAAFVAGGVSTAFVRFSLQTTLAWGVGAALQIALLRALRRWPPLAARWPLQIVAVAVVGALTQLTISALLIAPTAVSLGLESGSENAGSVGAWTFVLVAAYMVWEREARTRHASATRRLLDVQQAQLRLQRRLVEAQLEAAQARVDPGFFFATLDAIEALYAARPDRAEALFDALVAFLRTALLHPEHGVTLLAREVALAQACVHIVALASGRALRCDVAVEAALAQSPFPAGVLLPLVRAALEGGDPGSGDGTVSIAAGLSADGARLELRITAPALPGAAVRAAVAATLRARDADATIAVEAQGVVLLRVPHGH